MQAAGSAAGSRPWVRPGWALHALVGGAIVVALVLRATVRPEPGLLEDELIAGMHALQPFWRIPFDCLRFDIHPPLYFMQLHVWALAGRDDLWLVGNSEAWGLAALVSMWFARRDRDGPVAALLAVGVLAVAPSALWMTQEVRPYAFMAVLLIWMLRFTEDFGQGRAGPRQVAGLAALAVALVYSHAIGFLAVLYGGLYALWLVVARGAPAGAVRRWTVLYGLLALVALPVLANSMVRDANIGEGTSTPVLRWMCDVVAFEGGTAWSRGLGAVLYGVIVAVGLSVRDTRAMTACFILLPMLLAVAMAAGFKPVFKANVFACFMLPALAIVAGRLLASVPERLRTPASAGVFGLVGAMSLAFYLFPPADTVDPVAGHDFIGAARAVERGFMPGDVLYIPQAAMLNGLAWYLSSARVPVPDDVGEPASDTWKRIHAPPAAPRLAGAALGEAAEPVHGRPGAPGDDRPGDGGGGGGGAAGVAGHLSLVRAAG